jgi:hypothetical protein
VATTLKVITEDDQIQTAKTIFRGKVEAVNAAFKQTGQGRPIVTTVRFSPLTVYKGEAKSPVSLTFLGGKVGDRELRVSGMPHFEVGQEYILFVSADSNVACPVIGWTEGSLKVNRKASAAGLVELPTGDPAELAISARSRKVRSTTNDLPGFESRLRQRITELGAKP